ncbi:MAG: nucleotidyltransferase domain-containing protein [Lachnoclostridium sp.]|nr:nucleotidyltransferase domain-containing protein [Lachnospiraceae bacterium]MCM1249501.1 nucleotidyltransferase domain-containing protein [Lachnoclostridium sp.]
MQTMAQLDNVYRKMAECYHSVYGMDLKEIFLYGSYARGDFNKESDIDIAAIVKGNRTELQEKLKKVWDVSADVGLEHDVVVSPIVIPLDEFEEYKDKLPYYMNILKEGKRIG